MADPIPFPARKANEAPIETEEGGPHIAGPAFCGACGNEWSAVAPVGSVHLECPKCHRMWGAYKNAVSPPAVWRCNCGEELFWLTVDGAMCRRCGIITTDWADVR